MEEDMTDVIAVAGDIQAQKLAQELHTAGIAAMVREAQGPQAMYVVAVDSTQLAEARDILAALQNCECHQEDNGDEPLLSSPHRRHTPWKGFIE